MVDMQWHEKLMMIDHDDCRQKSELFRGSCPENGRFILKNKDGQKKNLLKNKLVRAQHVRNQRLASCFF